MSVSLKGETLCSVKDFRINIYIPGDEDMILLRLGSAASRLVLDRCPAEHLQHRGENVKTSYAPQQLTKLNSKVVTYRTSVMILKC